MIRGAVVVLAAFAVGAVAGEFLARMEATHRWIGQIVHRGELTAFVDHHGIFGGESVADEVLRVRAGRTAVESAAVDRAMSALRGEFAAETDFTAALRASGIWKWQLRRALADTFRGEEWIERKIGPPISVSDAEARRYYDAHSAEFVQPLRIRPRHIFLAAPAGSENIEGKRTAMQEIIARLQGGEDFTALAAAVSEDEATKTRGGDLDFVAKNRVPPEFWEAIESLPVDGSTAFVQSHLGFHAVQVLEILPPRTMSLEEARPEIEQKLRDRTQAVEALRAQLAGQAQLVGR